MNRKAQHDIARKLKVLNYAIEIGNISKTCRYFGICRETFYKWKRAYEADGASALIDSKPCPAVQADAGFPEKVCVTLFSYADA